MSIALYRKYRPKNFAEVSGQNHIKITLQNEIESDRVVHAYMFCGPRGTGKTTLARLLSKAVNCTDIQASGEPCNKCQSCEDIIAGKALDIIEIDAASHTGVDNVRENIIQNARFTPTKKKFKVFIIDEVHMLSISAFNALLKILEEPPKYVIFILATTEAHKVPSTIISRCQRFDFKKINLLEIVERLKWIVGREEIRVDEKVLSLIAKQSGGCVRDAESLLEQVLSLGEKNITLEQSELILPKTDFDLLYKLFEFIINKQTAEAIELINKMVEDGIDIAQFTDGLIEFVRKTLIYKISNNLQEFSREVDEDVVNQVMKLLPKLDEVRMTTIIKKLIITKDLFKQNYLSQLPLEIAVFDLTASGKPMAKPVLAQPENVVPPPPQPQPEPQVQAEPEPKPVEPQLPSLTPSLQTGSEVQPQSQNEPQPQPAPQPPPLTPSLQTGSEVQPQLQNESQPQPEPQSPPLTPSLQTGSEVQSQSQNEPQPQPAPASVGVLDLNLINEKWQQILNKVKQEHSALHMSLQMGKPISQNGQTVVIGFLFEIQRQRIESPVSKRIVQDLMQEVVGHQLQIETKIEPGLSLSDISQNSNSGPAPEMSVDASAADVASEFDGEVIDEL
ncbi:DNA polymerase III subunit gamma/tau [Candidatus Kuenenbacteria bacterium]|nr:DNA polymerase III subunit gamma/tau [Candidatus Kuenenbacteria bacterium]